MSLNPITDATREEVRYLTALVFDGLYDVRPAAGASGAIVPGLVQGLKCKTAINCNELDLVLRRNALWHDGRPVDADDVVFTWEALHKSESPIKGWLDDVILTVRKGGDAQTVHLVLKVALSQEALTKLLSRFKVIPREFTKDGKKMSLPSDLRDQVDPAVQAFNREPIGTGPFRVSHHPVGRIEMVRNDSYFRGAPKIPRLVFVQKDDIGLSVKALVDGNAGLILGVPVESEPQFMKLGKPSVYRVPYEPYAFYAIAYNTSAAPFKELAFRQGLTRATDKVWLFRSFTNTTTNSAALNPASFISTGVYPSHFEFVQENPKGFPEAYPLNQGAAKDSIRGTSFKLLFNGDAGRSAQALADAYRKMMAQVSVTVELVSADSGEFRSRLETRQFQAAFTEFTDFDELYDLRSLFRADSKRNIFGVQDEGLRKLLDEYASTLERDTRREKSIEIHRAVAALVPAAFLFVAPRNAYANAALRDVRIHPFAGFVGAEEWSVQ